MSLLPSPSKSPRPWMCQSLGTAAWTTPPSALTPQAVHLPDVDRSAVVTPEKVTLPIAVEVAEALDVPVVGDESVRGGAFGFDRQAIHLPEIDRPAVVAPRSEESRG